LKQSREIGTAISANKAWKRRWVSLQEASLSYFDCSQPSVPLVCGEKRREGGGKGKRRDGVKKVSKKGLMGCQARDMK
jgi:hypothetical protein